MTMTNLMIKICQCLRKIAKYSVVRKLFYYTFLRNLIDSTTRINERIKFNNFISNFDICIYDLSAFYLKIEKIMIMIHEDFHFLILASLFILHNIQSVFN